MTGATVDSSRELEAAYTENRERLLNFLTRRLKCRHAAEDVVQDVFLAIPNVRSIRPVRNPSAFLFRIAGNLAINRTQQERRRRELREANAAILWTAVDEVTPDRCLLGVEALARIEAAISGLPDRTRQILAWRRIDGLTNREVAERLGISLTAVEKHMRRAMATLVRTLGEDLHG